MYVAINPLLIALLAILPGSLTVLADSHEHDMDMSQMEEMDHSGHRGPNIHNSSVDGHSLAYHLIDLREKMKDMDNMPEDAGHASHDGLRGQPGRHTRRRCEGSYLVIGPDGETQRHMAMGMKDGFGADINSGHPAPIPSARRPLPAAPRCWTNSRTKYSSRLQESLRPRFQSNPL